MGEESQTSDGLLHARALGAGEPLAKLFSLGPREQRQTKCQREHKRKSDWCERAVALAGGPRASGVRRTTDFRSLITVLLHERRRETSQKVLTQRPFLSFSEVEVASMASMRCRDALTPT